VARHRGGDGLAERGVGRGHALDGGVVEAHGTRLAAEFAQFAQLVDHTHDYFSSRMCRRLAPSAKQAGKGGGMRGGEVRAAGVGGPSHPSARGGPRAGIRRG